MRYALIDNSTMTAVQRLLGDIPVVNKLSLDGDIAAFENLIQAILFYDNLFYIDDYKIAFKDSRKSYFNYMLPIDSRLFPYDSLRTKAHEITEDIILKVVGGAIDKNEFGKFFEMLKMHTTFTWDMRSSVWFLTMKMLEGTGGIDINKYTTLNDMIFLELQANSDSYAEQYNWQTKLELISSNGVAIPASPGGMPSTGEITKQIFAFSSSLNWLSFRTAFYSLVATHYDADVFLHPIRSSFQLSLAERLGLPLSTYKPILDCLSGRSESTIKDIKNNTDPIVAKLNLPLFSAWLVEKTGNPLLIVEEAFRIRSDKPFVEARQQLIELEELSADRNVKDFTKNVNRLVASLQSLSNVFKQIYGVTNRNGISLAPIIFAMNTLGKMKGLPSIPNTPIKIPLPDKVLEIGTKKGFKGVYRSIIQDLIAIERLGKTHEKLSARVVYKDRPQNIHMKTEDIRYFGKASHWKLPM